MNRSIAALAFLGGLDSAALAQGVKDRPPLNVNPPHITSAKSIKYDYDIVYVRAPRLGDSKQIAWSEVFSPLRAEPGADLMLLDGIAAGQNLASKFHPKAPGVWELMLSRPVTELPPATIDVSVQDRQGNLSRIERKFFVAPAK